MENHDEEIWTFINGAWGDAFAAYGNICKLLEEKQNKKTNIVYFGMDADVIKFLNEQWNVGKIKHLLISEPAAFYKYNFMASRDFTKFLEVTGLKDQIPDLLPTHISSYYLEDHPNECNRDFNYTLPEFDGSWWPFLSSKRPFLLFQPFSVRSCSGDKHWEHWNEAITWALDNTNLHVVLVGELTSQSDPKFEFPWFEHPRLINIVGQTKSLIDVLHIATWAEGIVTTSNCLSMWSIIAKKPALVVCNQNIQERATYYYNWINYRPNVVLDATTSLQEFQSAYEEWIRKLSGGDS